MRGRKEGEHSDLGVGGPQKEEPKRGLHSKCMTPHEIEIEEVLIIKGILQGF